MTTTATIHNYTLKNLESPTELETYLTPNTSGLTVYIATAKWSKESKSINPADFTVDSNQNDTTLTVVQVHIDDNEDVEEAAIDFGLLGVPSCKVYRGSKLITTLTESVTPESIQTSITKALKVKVEDMEDQHAMISSAYASTSSSATTSNPGGCCVSVNPSLMGYTASDLLTAGASVLGLGCGNPLSFAELKQGETVVDLGSGAGIDCFIAGAQVGINGRVIGVDMTREMITLARQHAKSGAHTNVEFRLGEIEYLPVGDGIVDCVISNCVINLSPDKQQVINDIFRVLKSNGRIAISDVVARPGVTLPPHLRNAEALAC